MTPTKSCFDYRSECVYLKIELLLLPTLFRQHAPREDIGLSPVQKPFFARLHVSKGFARAGRMLFRQPSGLMLFLFASLALRANA